MKPPFQGSGTMMRLNAPSSLNGSTAWKVSAAAGDSSVARTSPTSARDRIAPPYRRSRSRPASGGGHTSGGADRGARRLHGATDHADELGLDRVAQDVAVRAELGAKGAPHLDRVADADLLRAPGDHGNARGSVAEREGRVAGIPSGVLHDARQDDLRPVVSARVLDQRGDCHHASRRTAGGQEAQQPNGQAWHAGSIERRPTRYTPILPASLSAARHRAVHFPALHALADRDPLVMELLPLPEPQLRLRPALRPVETERYQREPTLLDLAPQALQLPAVHQELPRPLRLVPELARRSVGADVGAHQEELLAEEASVGVLQVRAVVAQGFHLAAGQDETGLEALEDVVVVEGPAVLRDVPLAGLLGHPTALSGPGTSARFSRMRFSSSTKTTFGWYSRATSSSSQV